MKFSIFTLALLVFLCSGCTGEKTDPKSNGKIVVKKEVVEPFLKKETVTYDVRKVKWGMTIAQVKKSEEPKKIQKDKKFPLGDNHWILSYSDSVFGYKIIVTYLFKEGKLKRTDYALDLNHKDYTKYKADYKNVKDSLSKIYGKPVEKQESEYSIVSQWETDNTLIELSLWRDVMNTKSINVTVVYYGEYK
jgi:hypothetical protein